MGEQAVVDGVAVLAEPPYELEEMAAIPAAELGPRARADELRRPRVRTAAGHQRPPAEVSGRRWVWVEVVHRLAGGVADDGSPCVVASARGVTERRRVQDELEASQRRLGAVVASAADGIIVIDGTGIVQTFNPAAERIFGRPALDVVGHDLTMLMPERWRAAPESQLAHRVATGEGRIVGTGRPVVVEGRRGDGAVFPLELTLEQVEDPDTSLFVGVMRASPNAGRPTPR